MLTAPLIIELEGEPVAKGRARFRIIEPKKGGRFVSTYTPKKTVTYEDRLREAARVVMADHSRIDEGALIVTVWVYRPIPPSWSKKKQQAAREGRVRPTGRPDWDNFGKITDALNGVVWKDDAQIVDGRAVKLYSDKPCLRVEILPFVFDAPLLAGAV
jgi:Holliday junction resolvase RusA-like endonuclease